MCEKQFHNMLRLAYPPLSCMPGDLEVYVDPACHPHPESQPWSSKQDAHF